MSLEHIGRYRLTGELGKGAMGIVYTAQDPTIGRVVALKTMRLDVSGMDAQELLHRFRNEARAAGVLSHPNIVTIYDAGEHEGLFYMAMEYIQGQTLQSLLLGKHVLPVEQILDIARQVCAGLDYAHGHGVIHRDVKPANVMIAPDGTVKIMDFGIAKAGAGMTSAGQVLGTPNYMSPEQVKGKPLDGRSDLFSVGVILYEMLTGEKPFVGQNVTTIIYKIVNENPIAPRELDVTIHPGLSAVVTRALAKSPAERYQTGAELARDLQNYKSFGAAGEPTLVLDAAAYEAKPAPVAAATATAAAPARAVASVPAPVPNIEATVPLPRKPLAEKLTTSLRLPAKLPLKYVLAGILVLAIAAAGLGYARHLRARRREQAQAPPAATAPQAPPETAATPPPAAPAAAEKPAEPPLAPKPATGDLRLESTPAGAHVQIDGRSDPAWLTPMTLPRLKPGTHTVTLSKPGFVSEIRAVDVVVGKRTLLEIELPSSRPLLVLNSTPAGAEVVIDDKPTGMLTPAEITVDAGQHTLALRKPGFENAGTVARLTDGQRFNFSPTLQPRRDLGGRIKKLFGAGDKPKAVPAAGDERGHLQIRTVPKGAEILINGFVLPRRTPLRFPLRPGKYDLVLRLEGYLPVHKKIDLAKDQVLQINEILGR
jgi:serine/threonine-protein kinase